MTNPTPKPIGLKSITLGNHSYTPVNERINWVRDNYPNYKITTTLITPWDADEVWVEATFWPDYAITERFFNGRAQSKWITGEKKKNKWGKEIDEVDRTSALENAECVPLDTSILTREGFRFYHQLRLGDEVLTYNVEMDVLEWQPLIAINTFENQPLVEMSTSRFSAVCTHNHKWVVNNGTTSKLIPQNEIEYSKGNNKLILSAAEPMDVIGNAKFASALGWLFSDGQITYSNDGIAGYAVIRQSKKENFPILSMLFGDNYREVDMSEYGWMPARSWTVKAEEVRAIMGYFRVNSMADLPAAVCKMTVAEVSAYYSAMMSADGYERGFGKSYPEIIEAMQIAATRLGVKTGHVTVKEFEKSTKPFYILPLHKGNGAYTSEIVVRNIPPRDVWCPTVKNGTWVARQDGQVWITGNTSSIGRALAAAGIGTEVSYASADEINKASYAEGRSTPVAPKAPVNFKAQVPVAPRVPAASPESYKCELCPKDIDSTVRNYSLTHFKGHALCYTCQMKVRKAPEILGGQPVEPKVDPTDEYREMEREREIESLHNWENQQILNR